MAPDFFYDSLNYNATHMNLFSHICEQYIFDSEFEYKI